MPVFYHTGALGDFLLALPFLRAARRALPDASWTLVAKEDPARLVERVFPWKRRVAPGMLEFSILHAEAPDKGELVSLLERYGGLMGFVSDAARLESLARDVRPGAPVLLAEPFSRVTSQGGTIEACLEDVLSRLEGRRVRVEREHFSLAARELPPLGVGEDALGFLASSPGTPPQTARDPQVDGLRAKPAPRSRRRDRLALIHGGASGRDKMAPRDLIEAIAERLAAAGWTVGWIVGPVEVERRHEAPGGPALVCPDIVHLAHAVLGARLYIGCDTGPTHLASALGVPTVSIHGRENLPWRPRGVMSRVVGGSQGFPSVADVIRIVQDLTGAS